jgi:phytoene dehydrogenase-like protein
MTERIERQIERFAPGFRDLVRERHAITAVEHEVLNANMVGGDIGGGSNDLAQFVARPVLRYDPYATPNERLFICSSATPPGGGVHGMCGYWAARSALERLTS